MRTIKFRGKAINGDWVYGDLTHYNGHCFVADKRVDPDSVAQFCGLDSDDNEIYEGDTVIALNYGRKNFTAEFAPSYGLFKNFKHCRKK